MIISKQDFFSFLLVLCSLVVVFHRMPVQYSVKCLVRVTASD